jgi:hypothetical protein
MDTVLDDGPRGSLGELIVDALALGCDEIVAHG